MQTANKNVVLSFLEHLLASKFDAALALLADSGPTVWIAGKPDKSVLAGTITKAQFAERVKGIGVAMPKGLVSPRRASRPRATG